MSKQSNSSRGVLSLAGIALAVVSLSMTGLSSQAQAVANSMRTETRLRVETSNVGARSIPTFTAHVDQPDQSPASGAVLLMEGSHQLASAALDENGDAKIVTDNLSAGTHSIHAVYVGVTHAGESLLSSSSPETQVTAEASGVPNFSITPLPALSVVKGATLTSIVTLTPINGFTGYVTLSCSQLTPDSNCSYIPASVFVNGTTTSPSTLSIETYAATGALARQHSSTVYAILLPGLLGLAGLGLRRRKAWQQAAQALLAIAILGGMIGGMSGCAQRYHYLNKPPEASPGTPLGSTTFILEAQSISGTTVITHSITVALTVTAPAS